MIKDNLLPGDLFGIPPINWWEERLCSIIDAKTFHWGMFVMLDGPEWIITESISKGPAITRFTYPRSHIRRIRALGMIDPVKIISAVSQYGGYPYDWDVNYRTAIWWFAKHYLGKALPIERDKQFNCQEYVVMLANVLADVNIIPGSEYPDCVNIETSPELEYLGELIQ